MERVLLVDPDLAMYEQVAQTLLGEFALHHARTAAEALASLKLGLPDLIISEVELPDMSGLRLCEQVRANARTSGLPLLFLTTRADIKDKVDGFLAGADDYVVKPIDPRYFSARIRLLFRLKALQQKRPSSGNGSSSHSSASQLY